MKRREGREKKKSQDEFSNGRRRSRLLPFRFARLFLTRPFTLPRDERSAPRNLSTRRSAFSRRCIAATIQAPITNLFFRFLATVFILCQSLSFARSIFPLYRVSLLLVQNKKKNTTINCVTIFTILVIFNDRSIKKKKSRTARVRYFLSSQSIEGIEEKID